MKNYQLHRGRLIVGLALVAAAILMFLFTDSATVGVIAIGVLGLVAIATSRSR